MVLDVAALAAAPDGVRRAALHAAIVAAGVVGGAAGAVDPAGSVGRVHVLAVDALVVGWHGQGPVSLPGGIEAIRRCGRLLLRQRTDAPDDEGTGEGVVRGRRGHGLGPGAGASH